MAEIEKPIGAADGAKRDANDVADGPKVGKTAGASLINPE